MENLGNKVTFAADEVETYQVGTDGALTVTLKQDTRTDTAYNLEDQDMPKINANDIPSYEGHEGVVKSANGGLYDVATDKPDNIRALDGRDIGDVSFVTEEERRDRAIAEGREDRDGNTEVDSENDRSSEGTDNTITVSDASGETEHPTPLTLDKSKDEDRSTEGTTPAKTAATKRARN